MNLQKVCLSLPRFTWHCKVTIYETTDAARYTFIPLLRSCAASCSAQYSELRHPVLSYCSSINHSKEGTTHPSFKIFSPPFQSITKMMHQKKKCLQRRSWRRKAKLRQLSNSSRQTTTIHRDFTYHLYLEFCSKINFNLKLKQFDFVKLIELAFRRELLST